MKTKTGKHNKTRNSFNPKNRRAAKSNKIGKDDKPNQNNSKNKPNQNNSKNQKNQKNNGPPNNEKQKYKPKTNQFKKSDSNLQESVMQGKFRMINEELYTKSSKDGAIAQFKNDARQFADYHDGYRQQVLKWPKNPLDMIISELSKEKYWSKKIGDFGCGEGKLQLQLEKLKRDDDSMAYPSGSIHSFDAGKLDTSEQAHITQCDISSVPLKYKQLDIAVFCLSLMGTNYVDFIVEANRVMKPDGILFIAEVLSRFTDMKIFTDRLMLKAGFFKMKVSKMNDFFYIMVFKKVKDVRNSSQLMKLSLQGPPKEQQKDDEEQEDQPLLKACLYKKR